jgi:stage IV sporulation protein FB
MFGEVSRTPRDIHFQILGIPCRIHPYFWLSALFFAWPRNPNLPGNIILTLMILRIACLLVSILVHELGHAVLIRWAGFPPEIVLHAFGGYALYHPYRTVRTGVAVAISFAGPAAGFVLYGLVKLIEIWVTTAYRGRVPFQLQEVFAQMEWINLYWGLVNLLPVYPLDGGQISRTVLQSWYGTRGLRLSLGISIVAAAATAVYMYQIVGYPVFSWPVMMFALLAYESLQAYQGYSTGPRW